MAKTRLYPVPFYIGDGSERMFIYVASYSEYPRDVNHLCAFCHGDPCAERSGPETDIAQYIARAMAAPWRHHSGYTCPLCEGRPS
jgi:hypothetical protein